nr:basic proline-rich protein-like [Pongo pygmaeus]
MALTATRAEQSLCRAVPGPRRRRTPREAEAGSCAGDRAPGTTPTPARPTRAAEDAGRPRDGLDRGGAEMLPAPGVRPVRPRPAPPLCPPRSRAQASPGPREARSVPGPLEGRARRPAPSRPRSCTTPQPLPLTVRHGPAKSPTPRSPPGRPNPGRAAAALSARPGRASRRPLSAAPASLGHLKETGPPAALLPAPCSPPQLPSSPPPSLGSTAASSRQEASLTPPALLSARPPPSRPRPLPPHATPPPRPRFRPSLVPRLHRGLPPSRRPAGHAPRRTHPGCSARFPFALLRTGIPSPSGSDRPSCQAHSPGRLSCSVKINSVKIKAL